MSEEQFVMVEGSHHAAHPSCYPFKMVPPDQYYQITILLRRRGDAKPFPDPHVIGALPLAERTYLSIEELEQDYGASEDDADARAAYFTPFGLTVDSTDLGRRTMTVGGLAMQFAAAFRTTLLIFSQGGSFHRSYVGGLQMPEDLADSVIAITGLDERPVSVTRHQPARGAATLADHAHAVAMQRTQADLGAQTVDALKSIGNSLSGHADIKALQKTHDALIDELSDSRAPAALGTYGRKIAEPLKRANAAAADVIAEHGTALTETAAETARAHLLDAIEQTGIKTAPQIADLYDFPKDTDGTGQCIAIVELGGGYLKSDLDNYLAFLGLPEVDIHDVEVAGGKNAPGVIEPYDAEVALDIQVIAGAAPGAKLVVYFAPLHARGFVEAVQAALYDKPSRPRVLSISWDLSEGFWLGSPMHVRHLEDLFETAAALGVTILALMPDWPRRYRSGVVVFATGLALGLLLGRSLTALLPLEFALLLIAMIAGAAIALLGDRATGAIQVPIAALGLLIGAACLPDPGDPVDVLVTTTGGVSVPLVAILAVGGAYDGLSDRLGSAAIQKDFPGLSFQPGPNLLLAVA